MPTDEKTPIASYNSAMASVKDAVAAANAASLEAARAKKRTAAAATEAVNGSMFYVARKLLKHALGNCSREMYDNYESYGPTMRELADMVKGADQLVPQISGEANMAYCHLKRQESEASRAAVIAANAAAAAVSAAKLHLRVLPVEVFEVTNDVKDRKIWVDRVPEPAYSYDDEEHDHTCFIRLARTLRPLQPTT